MAAHTNANATLKLNSSTSVTNANPNAQNTNAGKADRKNNGGKQIVLKQCLSVEAATK